MVILQVVLKVDSSPMKFCYVSGWIVVKSSTEYLKSNQTVNIHGEMLNKTSCHIKWGTKKSIKKQLSFKTVPDTQTSVITSWKRCQLEWDLMPPPAYTQTWSLQITYYLFSHVQLYLQSPTFSSAEATSEFDWVSIIAVLVGESWQATKTRG